MIQKQRLVRINHDTRRDYSHHLTFGSPVKTTKLLLPPAGLGRKPLSIKDQGQSNYCTGYTIAEVIENQTGVLMSEAYVVALEGMLAGSPIFAGVDPMTALQTGRKLGALAKASAPLSFEKDGWQIPAEYQSWPRELLELAYMYHRPSFYSITAGGPDDFDIYESIRLALWDARDDKAPIVAFGYWYPQWQQIGSNGVLPTPTTPPWTRHAYTMLDWTEKGIIVLSHQGEKYGDGGICYLPQEAANYVFKDFIQNGLGMYIYRSKNPPFAQVFSSWIKKFI